MNKPNMNKKEHEKNKSEKDREDYGFGYDKSVDDLKVVGQNNQKKMNK